MNSEYNEQKCRHGVKSTSVQNFHYDYDKVSSLKETIIDLDELQSKNINIQNDKSFDNFPKSNNSLTVNNKDQMKENLVYYDFAYDK